MYAIRNIYYPPHKNRGHRNYPKLTNTLIRILIKRLKLCIYATINEKTAFTLFLLSFFLARN